tara:strand:- start:150 stop:863 length:714 start_codon:yes stop_codon:yes gene_type:complete
MNSAQTEFFDIIPVSVIDIKHQMKRKLGNASSTSSRSEHSPFPEEVSDLCFQFFLKDCKNIFDCFAGWGDRALKAKEWKKNYIGYDSSEDAIKISNDKGCNNILANSLTAEIPQHDGLITCPPYWNLEKYNGDGIDRIKTWEDFIIQYKNIFMRCWDRAEIGSTYCVMIGEWRKNHIFYDLEYETRKIFKELGAVLFDQIIMSRKKVSKIPIMLPQAKRLGYTVRVHETLLIYKKNK